MINPSDLPRQEAAKDINALGDVIIGSISQNINISSYTIPKPTGFPQNIPASSTSKFVGREKELILLHQKLQQNNLAVIQGMGGIGKTELAIKYSLLHLQLDDYPGGICWLRTRRENIGLQIIQFCRTNLGLKPPENVDLTDQVKWCWNYWREGNTLVILDDLQSYPEVKPYLPPQLSQFKVLITTRLKLDLSGSLSLEILSESEAIILLIELIGSDKISQESDRTVELCRRLGCLPLALQLVGRYVKKRKISLAEMLVRLEGKGIDHPALVVVQDNSNWTLNIERGVEAAFELSWEELSGTAQELGCLISLFALAPIPWWLVENAASEQEAEDLEGGRVELEDLHFLQGEDNYQLHKLIRDFFIKKQKNLVTAEKQKYNLCQTMVIAAQKIPETLTQNDVKSVQNSIPHLEEIAEKLIDFVNDKSLISIFIGLVRYYIEQGLYSLAEPWQKQCVSLLKTRLGETHVDVATSYGNLGNIYYLQGRYQKAEFFLLKSLEITSSLLGQEHPNVARSYNALALVYNSQGKYQESESYYLQSLELYSRLLGDEYFGTASSTNGLALVYNSQGKYQEAEPLFLKSLEILCKLRGQAHPDIATIYTNLGSIYDSQGKYQEAESYHFQSLEILRNQLGDEHPKVAMGYNNLASVYNSQGKYQEAESYYLQSLEILHNRLGEHHPYIATIYNNLASVYNSQGKYQEAESYYLQSLEILHNKLGEEYPYSPQIGEEYSDKDWKTRDVAQSHNGLALVYNLQGRYQEAESLFLKSLELRRKLLGEEHPDTTESYNGLALVYNSQGRYQEAESLFLKSLELRRKLLGEEHPDTTESYNGLALVYNSQGRYQEAESLFLKSLEFWCKLLGEDHPKVASGYANLANIYYSQGRYQEAESLFLQSLELWRKLLGEDHSNVAQIYNGLANIYNSQGRYQEAESYYLQSLELNRKFVGEEHLNVAIIYNNLASIYQSQEIYQEAESYYVKSLELSRKILLGEEYPNIATIYYNLANVYQLQGRYQEAESYYIKSLELSRKLLSGDHPDVVSSYKSLIGFYYSQGRYQEAKSYYLQFKSSENILNTGYSNTNAVKGNLNLSRRPHFLIYPLAFCMLYLCLLIAFCVLNRHSAG